MHNLGGPGPGYMVVKLGLAAADGQGAGGPASAGPGQLAGGATSLQKESKIPRQVRVPTPSPRRRRLIKTQPQTRKPHNQTILVSVIPLCIMK